MKIIIKNPTQIAGIQKAAQLATQVLKELTPYVRAGVTTIELDKFCHQFITAHAAIPAPLNYQGFPKSICTSLNQVVCHGIPNSKTKLRRGDIINIDVTVLQEGYFADTSAMYAIEPISKPAKKLIEATRQALYLGILEVAPGKHFGNIGWAIQTYAQKQQLSVVREYCGHGVGLQFHEAPCVMHVGEKNQGPVMEPGMIFTIEPMLNLGSAKIRLLQDGWTVVTADGQLSAQWEHTILVTETGYQILTWREDEPIPPAS